MSRKALEDLTVTMILGTLNELRREHMVARKPIRPGAGGA
jgi:hypothetical protein